MFDRIDKVIEAMFEGGMQLAAYVGVALIALVVFGFIFVISFGFSYIILSAVLHPIAGVLGGLVVGVAVTAGSAWLLYRIGKNF